MAILAYESECCLNGRMSVRRRKHRSRLTLEGFIFEVLARPAVKALAKPGAAVVRTITEKGMNRFTATRHFAEFKLVAYSGTANLN